MIKAATFRVWIAGDYDDAVRALRRHCDRVGDCYSVSRCDYVFSGGMEAGVCVTRINYARFPEEETSLLERVKDVASLLADALCQKSYSIETPSQMLYIQREGPWS